jgi:hypothetical protein
MVAAPSLARVAGMLVLAIEHRYGLARPGTNTRDGAVTDLSGVFTAKQYQAGTVTQSAFTPAATRETVRAFSRMNFSAAS